MAEREIKRLKSKLTGQVNLLENLMRNNDKENTEKEMENMERVLSELQEQVTRYIDACEEGETGGIEQMKEMLKAEEESVRSVKAVVEEWLVQLDNSNKKSSDSTSESKNGGMNISSKEKKGASENSGGLKNGSTMEESNVQRTLEIIKIQLDLQRQVELFDKTAYLKDKRTVKTELEEIESTYNEMISKATPLTSSLPEDGKEKVLGILRTSESDFLRVQGIGKSQMYTENEDRKSTTSGRSRSGRVRTKEVTQAKRSLSVGGNGKSKKKEEELLQGRSTEQSEGTHQVHDTIAYKTWE